MTIPTLTDIEDSKKAMDDIQSFTYLSNNTFIDAKGTTRETITGRIKKMGYAVPVDYTVGILFDSNDNVKTVDESGVVYAPLPSSLPFTTSGTWGLPGVSGDNLKFFVVQGNNNNSVNVVEFGANADNGVTDNSAAFTDAAATGLAVFVPNPGVGNYYKINNVQLLPFQTIYSFGAEVRGDGAFAIKHADGSTAKGLRFGGAGKGIGAGSGGIIATGVFSSLTVNCRFKNINGAAYQTDNAVDRHQGNILSNFVIEDCVTGIFNGFRGEYGKHSNGSVFGCDVGVSVSGGNNNYSTISITDNLIGVMLNSSQNDSHGVMSNCVINHNTVFNIQCDAIIAKAFNFVGCEIYAGNIWLNFCEGVTFTSCELSIVTIFEEGARYCQFAACHFVSQMTFNSNYNGSSSEVYYSNSNIHNDTNMTRPTWFPEGSYQKATLETHKLGLVDGSITNILDTASVTRINGNPSFEWQKMFQTSNNKFHGDKKTRVNGSIIHFTGEVGITRPTSYLAEDDVSVEIRSTVRGIIARAKFARQSDDGSTLFTNVYRFDASIARENDEYEVVVVNKSSGDINVYRDQQGDLICFVEAWGW